MLEPKEFVRRVILGAVAVDSGDWLQPLYRQERGTWRLCKLEVLFRLRDPTRIPFPAFMNFVQAATDHSDAPDTELRAAFEDLVVASVQRVDKYLSAMSREDLQDMRKAGIFMSINVTAKQLRSVLAVPLRCPDLIALEETEYDNEPDALTQLRLQAWTKFRALSLDDVLPTLADLEDSGSLAQTYVEPRVPLNGDSYKALPRKYNHDIPFARRFIRDFRRAREMHPDAQAEVKLSEDFCCYLIGVGHAPFARSAMSEWRSANIEASQSIRRIGLELIREAVVAGMTVCLEVSFADEDISWLCEAAPELVGQLCKQGGMSGPMAIPLSMVGTVFSPRCERSRCECEGNSTPRMFSAQV